MCEDANGYTNAIKYVIKHKRCSLNFHRRFEKWLKRPISPKGNVGPRQLFLKWQKESQKICNLFITILLDCLSGKSANNFILKHFKVYLLVYV